MRLVRTGVILQHVRCGAAAAEGVDDEWAWVLEGKGVAVPRAGLGWAAGASVGVRVSVSGV